MPDLLAAYAGAITSLALTKGNTANGRAACDTARGRGTIILS
jgi:hypothetical protein